LFFPESADLIFGEGFFHPADGVLDASQFVDFFGDEVGVPVEVLLAVEGVAFGLFEEDELGPEVAVVLVVDDRPLQRQSHSGHKRLGVCCQVAMGGALRELFLCCLLTLLALFLLPALGTVQDLQVRFGQAG